MTTTRAGAQIAGYRIEGVVGRGGMGTVYEATQVALDRKVALKVLTPALVDSPGFRERFRREATLQAALEHPNVVPIYEAGESEEGLFIAMRLVRGGDLKQLSGDEGMEPRRLLAILEQAASALDTAHAAGLIHRDVKPQNILVDDGDHAFLADFGLTRTAAERRSTLSGYTGSLDYAAPELIRGEPAGPSADLYAFAAVLLEALTGDVPYPVDNEASLLYSHLSDEPPPPSSRRPDLPPALDAVIARGLAKRPEQRYRSAGELVAAARRALDEPAQTSPAPRAFSETVVDAPVLRAAPVIAVEPSQGPRPWRAIALAAVVLLALFAGAFGIGRVLAPGPPARGHVRSGPLSLSFPSGAWKAVPAPAIHGLALQNVVGLRSTDASRPATLVAGIAPAAQGPALLPPALRSELTGAAPAHAVRLGSIQGLDYPTLPAGRVRWQTSLLLVPTSRGAAAVACLVPRVLEAGRQPGDCEAVAATLHLHGLRALPLGQTSAYTNRISSILTLLDGERLAARRQLAGATTPAEQARAAAAAAAGYAAAASSLAQVPPSPLARPAQDTLAAVLRTTAAAYRAAAVAATGLDKRQYDGAARRVDADERAVDAAVARLAAV